MDRLGEAVPDLCSGRPSPWVLGTWGGVLGASDSGKLGAFLPFLGQGGFLVTGLLTLAPSLMAPTFQEADPAGASQEALEAPQPFYPMDLEPLQEGEVKQWPKDAVILLVGD